MIFFRMYLMAALAAAAVWADCPEGSRPTTPAEQQFWTGSQNAIKAALPPAPEGWVLRDSVRIQAPAEFCKGGGPIPPLQVSYNVTYFSQEAQMKLEEMRKEREAHLKVVTQVPPDQQKQMDDLGRSARDLERQAQVEEVKNKNPQEGARLRAHANELRNQARALRQAHQDRINPQIQAIMEESFAAEKTVQPEVPVTVTVNHGDFRPSNKAPVQVGVPGAFRVDRDIFLPFGTPPASGKLSPASYTSAHTVWVRIGGSGHEAETIAKLFGGFNALLAKK